ncbi:conjugative transposon protein TraK [Pedobacter sp. Leaf194]|uniref:conjugative transposon protein TraK n=1 Tax=Pedobacter sp. Leaf194 TaxID=1736297 RepID=UPI00070327C9|nr:conjugative transposon protein TraK [Pedobacter sp. Leaf194]KQS36838.1 conjugal transfer protein [Pedobacter sp. Leaf194]
MFNKLKNIDSAFRHIKTFSSLMVVACILISIGAVWQAFRMVSQVQGRIYILAGGKALEAISAERKDNVAVELKDHIKMFHHYFFSLDPDEKVIATNIAAALNLADESAKKAYDNLKEQGYYKGLISANVSQVITVDSITVDLSTTPYLFRAYATQTLIRSSSRLSRRLITRGSVRNVSRSDNNPHGFLIQNWETLENNDLPLKP